MIKTLAGQIKQYKRASIATPLYMVLEVMMEMVIPLLMASIVDNGIEKSDLGHVYKVGAMMLVCALIGLFGGLMGARYGAKASTGFARNLRQTMFENIQRFSFANIDQFSTAGLVTRLTTDVTSLQNAYQMLLRMCVRAPISLVCALVMAFFINAKLASIYMVAVIVLGFILGLIVKYAMKYFSAVFKKYDDLNASVQENITAIRVVKAYVREDYEKSKFATASRNLYHMFLKAEGVIAWNAPVMMATIYSCILLISWIGAKMIVLSGNNPDVGLTKGQLMSLMTYCITILMNLMMLSMVFVMLTMSVAAGKRIAEVINTVPTLSNPENPVTEVKDGSIRFENVSFAYTEEGNNVLSNINLDIHTGETIGIIGGTGSAKTSLVNLISRLYDVREGSVKVGGLDVREYDMEALRNQVSVVLQKNVLFSGTILDNLRWGNEHATEEQCMEACRLACADEFIERMPSKYHTYIEQGGTNVSGGQKQRLCIARALLKQPKILILDDSTSAVDTATDAKIRAAFAEFIPETTKLIIAQRISSVQGADRIIVMDDGKINGFGTHDELLKNNKIYREVYESQTQGIGDFDQKAGGEL